MGVTYDYDHKASRLTISMPEDFNQDLVKNLRKTYTEYGLIKEYVIDFSDTQTIDSAAIGALFELKFVVKKTSAKLIINNVNNTDCVTELKKAGLL